MLRRLLLLAPLSPAAAVIAFAAATAAGAAVENGVAARPEAVNALRDVQVGERGRLMRVALICRSDCRVGARAGGAFFLPNIETGVTIDLKGRSTLARSLAFSEVEGGSALRIEAEAAVARASIKPCVIGGARASCIDVEFDEATGGDKVSRAMDASPDAPSEKPAATPATLTQPPLEAAPAAMATAGSVAAPTLREAPAQSLLQFARFAPPERLAAPASAPRSAGRSAPIRPQAASARRPDALGAARPILREDRAAALVARDIDIGEQARVILGKRLGVADCGGAEARLRADAWALDAMVDVGFCAAAAGRLDDADAAFTRLLSYTPDNYEALVGRALVAAKQGERSVARNYFQAALNALPPIEESNRIVDAMASL